jgi:hypothetical protein
MSLRRLAWGPFALYVVLNPFAASGTGADIANVLAQAGELILGQPAHVSPWLREARP